VSVATRHRAPRQILGLPAAAWVVAGLVLLVLLALAGGYGFHRDEMYFILAGRHPDFGYVDQPPLTPLLSAAAVQVLGLTPLAIRALPALLTAAGILICADTARILGAGRRGQLMAAVLLAVSGWLGLGHLDTTATIDAFFWTVAVWLVAGLLATPESAHDWHRWIALGLAMGIGLENKTMPIFLAASLAGGVLMTRRWDIVRAPGLWAAIGIAIVIWAPNLAWQAAHGFPQIEMSQKIAADNAGVGDKLMQVAQLLLMTGMFPIALAGLSWLARSPESARFRALGAAVLIDVALMIVTSGKSYYCAGFIPLVLAAGALTLDGWLAEPHAWPSLAPWVAVTAGCVAMLALPLVPAADLHSTPIPGIYQESIAQIGWPELAGQVEAVSAALAPEERAHAAIITANYGQYGALVLLGRDLPPVYSGHNAVWSWGRPADDVQTVILVNWSREWAGAYFSDCRLAATIDNGYDLPTEEQGGNILVCSNPGTPWAQLWPQLKHVD
jgi:4-amino-4-deoxy-L-arabinose transferase-like glycosyltransferase